MIYYMVLYKGDIEQKLTELSEVERRFKEGDNLIEVHHEGTKVFIRTKCELEIYKQIGFYKYKEIVEEEN